MSLDGYTASELAALELPGLPSTRQGVALRAERDGWTWVETTRSGSPARAYQVGDLPAEAQLVILTRDMPVARPVASAPKTPRERRPKKRADRAELRYRVTDDHRATARERLQILLDLDARVAAGSSLAEARAQLAAETGHADRSIRRWRDTVATHPRHEWLARLMPNFKPPAVRAEMHEEAWKYFKAYYLRPARGTFASAYRHTVEVAKREGWLPLPCRKAFERRLRREVTPQTETLLREGVDALADLYPAQRRDRSHFGALQALNADGHKLDVRVRWPDGDVVRPVLVAFQDLGSNKVLGWRLDKTENADLIRLAFGDVARTYGIPESVYFDNGKSFANKWMTGGTEHRFRFKVRAEDPRGILPQLGVDVHFVKPYSGRSKPIERMWREVCESVARHPLCDGAYVGSNPLDKPANYGTREVELPDLLRLVTAAFEEHNARTGRTSHVNAGRSFNETFAASYAEAPIRKATQEHLRMLLLAADGVRIHRATGKIQLAQNEYWNECLLPHRGEKVVVRFDPHHLHRGLHVSTLEGVDIGFAECRAAVGFDSITAAKADAKVKRTWLRNEVALAKAGIFYSPERLSEMHLGPAPEVPTSKVVAPMFGKTVAKAKRSAEAEAAFAPTSSERSRASLRNESDAMARAIGKRALDSLPRRKRPLAAGE